MMQTLRDIGVPIAGFAFHDDFSHRELNPWGYWDLPMAETINGLNTNEYDGCAVKLFGLQFARTRKEYIDCVIVCVRYRENAIKSTIKLLKYDGHLIGMNPTRENAERVYDSNYLFIDQFMRGLPYMIADFDTVLNCRELVKKELVKFITEKVGTTCQ
jgi:hypothetical protein